MSIYIQQADQLKKLTGEKLTSSKIIAALGFTPSTFDGDYESLTNKPITNSDDDNTTLYVQDSSGNIIAMINENGLTTVDVNVDGTSVKTFISSVETEIGSLSTKAEKSYVDERFNSLTFADIKGDPDLTDSDDSFSIADKNGYIIAHIDVNGLVTPAIKTSAIETTTITINGVDYVTAIEALEDAIGAVQGQANTNADNIQTNADNIQTNADDIDALQEIVTSDGLTYTATEFVIKDDLGNIALQLDDDALTVRYIKSDTTDAIKSQAESNAGAISGVAADLSDHTGDTDIHITAAERESWDAKATPDYVNQQVAALVDGAPETLDTLNELAAALKDNANIVDVLNESISNKADKTTVEGIQKEVDDAESEIDALQQIVTEDGLNYTATEFIIKNDIGEIALQLDGEALTVKNIKSDTTDNIIKSIETLSGRVDPLEQATHTHGNKEILDDIDVAFTSTLKQQYDKAEENVIEEITIDKGTVTMDGTTAKITGVAAQSDLDTLSGVVQTKANSSDLEAVDDRLETAEEEIDALQGLIDDQGLTFNNDEFVIEDGSQNTLAKFDASGLTVTAVNTETLNATEIVSPTIDNIKGQITPLETASHTHGNKGVLDDITASYTVEEKSKLEGIQAGAEVNIIESITTNNSKVTVDMNGTTAQIKGVAAQSDLDSLSGEVENKVDKETGKGLSTNDYTTTEKSKLEGISAGATKVEDSTTNGNVKIDDVETTVYSLPKATSSVLGGVKQGSNITIDGNGVISTHDPYELPIATASQLGGVKQGDNVTIASDGTISVEKYTLPENVLTENDLVNDLESSSTTQPLSAAQGKALQERINGLALGEENVIEKIQVNSVNQTIANKTVNISVPTTTNDLTNNSGFITKDVNNLTNYYKKDETLTKGEVETLVSGVTIEVDSELSDTSTNAVQNKVISAELSKKVAWVDPKPDTFTNILVGGAGGASSSSIDINSLVLTGDVINTLTDDSVDKPLSAAQGKALKTAIDSISGDIGDLGGGDMMKATYDTNNDGIVDNAERLGGYSASDFILNNESLDAGNASGLIGATHTATGSTTASTIGYMVDNGVYHYDFTGQIIIPLGSQINSATATSSGTVVTSNYTYNKETGVVKISGMVLTSAAFVSLNVSYTITSATSNIEMLQRRDTAANWASTNPILAAGEIGIETDTNKMKVGNGSSTWSNLDYISGSITVDTSLSASSVNPIANMTVYTALSQKQDKLTIDSALSSTSTNPVQNKVVTSQLNWLSNSINSTDDDVAALDNRITALEDQQDTIDGGYSNHGSDLQTQTGTTNANTNGLSGMYEFEVAATITPNSVIESVSFNGAVVESTYNYNTSSGVVTATGYANTSGAFVQMTIQYYLPPATIIQQRRDTSTNWTSANPVLAAGEIGIETDTNKMKVGNGSTAWNNLSYISGSITVDTGLSASSANPIANMTVYTALSNKQDKLTIDSTLSSTSTNPVQNKVIYQELMDLEDNKQTRLESGTNIKTINGESLLGSGDITITGSGEDIDLSNYVDLTSYQIITGNKVLTGNTTIGSTLCDKEAYQGTAGQILSSTGDGVAWIDAPSGTTDLTNYYTKDEVYSWVEMDELLDEKVSTSGGTITGNLSLQGNVESTGNAFTIQDNNNNIGLQFDKDGLTVDSIRINQIFSPELEDIKQTTTNLQTQINSINNQPMITGSDNITNIQVISQANYNALTTKSSTTLYIIVG